MPRFSFKSELSPKHVLSPALKRRNKNRDNYDCESSSSTFSVHNFEEVDSLQSPERNALHDTRVSKPLIQSTDSVDKQVKVLRRCFRKKRKISNSEKGANLFPLPPPRSPETVTYVPDQEESKWVSPVSEMKSEIKTTIAKNKNFKEVELDTTTSRITANKALTDTRAKITNDSSTTTKENIKSTDSHTKIDGTSNANKDRQIESETTNTVENIIEDKNCVGDLGWINEELIQQQMAHLALPQINLLPLHLFDEIQSLVDVIIPSNCDDFPDTDPILSKYFGAQSSYTSLPDSNIQSLHCNQHDTKHKNDAHYEISKQRELFLKILLRYRKALQTNLAIMEMYVMQHLLHVSNTKTKSLHELTNLLNAVKEMDSNCMEHAKIGCERCIDQNEHHIIDQEIQILRIRLEGSRNKLREKMNAIHEMNQKVFYNVNNADPL